MILQKLWIFNEDKFFFISIIQITLLFYLSMFLRVKYVFRLFLFLFLDLYFSINNYSLNYDKVLLVIVSFLQGRVVMTNRSKMFRIDYVFLFFSFVFLTSIPSFFILTETSVYCLYKRLSTV